ncbi:hypothetical protein BHE74_00036591 [Ensete ventricosum]|nr:hypothetical protein GW17_00024979 [Ensete ventricosum]RWW56679.1 hypothetical protein BHE74_00036591 [Ensete ventricosum]
MNAYYTVIDLRQKWLHEEHARAAANASRWGVLTWYSMRTDDEVCMGAGLQATFQKPDPGTLQVSFTGALQTKVDGSGADVMVALYESGLVTDCDQGENKGRVLTNDYVVRRLEKLVSVKDVSAKKNISGSVHFTLWDGFNGAKCGLLLFVQNASLQTFGVQQFQIPQEDTI